MNEPSYTMAHNAPVATRKRVPPWVRGAVLRLVEAIGVCLVAVGAALLEPAVGFIIVGVYVCFVANDLAA